MENDNEKPGFIQLLPYDIIIMILDYTSITDVIRFGRTCKQFNEIVKSSQGLWKIKLKNTVNETVYEEIERATDGNWYNEMKLYSSLKNEVHDRIMVMSAYYYKFTNEITLGDIKKFFNNSFSNGLAYYCTIDILQELVRKANKKIFMQISEKPYTLTEMFYSKIAVQHLLHSYLTIKWVQAHVKNDLPPEIVLNFFVQWVDPLKMHTDGEIEHAINSMANMVETELKKNHPLKSQSVQQMCAEGKFTQAQIIAAVSHVMYRQKRMTPVSVANLETLDVIRVIDMACGHHVVIAAIYHALAKRFGVRCELIAFPNHLFLELRGSDDKHVYKIELDTGKLTPKRSCPFSRNDAITKSYKYCPDSLLQYVISSFLTPMGSYKTWYMQNAINLLDFLSTNPNSDNKYKNYLPYLLDHSHLPALSTPVNIRRLTEEHLKIIALLSYLAKSPPIIRKEITVNARSGELKYAIGMIVQHKLYEYVCVVRGWELARPPAGAPPPAGALPPAGAPPPAGALPPAGAPQCARAQPFYIVVAVDQSDRYIAQEHLVDVSRPSRLYHLEDIIAREFTHFNGFAYEPNCHKRAEYPADAAVSARYRARAAALYGPRRG